MTQPAALQPGALQHVKVLDLSRVLAGPWAAQTLGDLGAEVIKVERPGCGDDTRAWGPPYVTDPSGAPTGESAYYMCTNRNKQSVTIDFTRPEGQELAKGGRVKVFGVASDKRVSTSPDVPTFAEAGLPGFEAYTWVGAMVSSKTPAAETAKLAELFTTISKMDETRAFYERLGATPMTGGPAQMHEFQKGEIALWQRIVQQAKVPLQ